MTKVISILLAVLVLWLLSPLLIYHAVIPALAIPDASLSPVYNAISALFSALAFTVIALTLWLQKKQLELQINELNIAKRNNHNNVQIAAYTALLTYYNSSGTSYNPDVCTLTPMDISKKLDQLIANSNNQ